MRVLFFILICFWVSFGDGLSFQGYSGLINTPNAQVIKEGDVVLHFNNQFDNNLRNYDYSIDIKSQEDYIFGVGFLPNLEVVGRLVEAKDGFARDLSANIKYKLPYESRYFPDIAIGVQDIGGSFNFYDNKYIVADKEFYNFRFSIGYGKASRVQRAKRMDGLFGGVEAKLTSWLSLIAEDDSKEQHAGVRLKTPPIEYLSNVRVDAILAQNLTHTDTSFGLNLVVPLKDKNGELSHLSHLNSLKSRVLKKKVSSLFDLQNLIKDFGFEDVRVGVYKKDVIYVEFENNLFKHNDLDALGVVIGLVANSGLNYKYYTVTLLKSRIQTISINGTLLSFKRYIENPTKENLYKLKHSLLISESFDTSDVKFIGDRENSTLFKPTLELSPGLLTTVGTEVGLFDYLVSLRSKLYLPLYTGLVATAMYEMPVVNSSNFDDGEVLNLMFKRACDSRWVNANLNQTFHYDFLFNTTSVGLFNTSYYGAYNQTTLLSPSGEHAINFNIGSFKHHNEKLDSKNHNIYEGGYRYYYSPFELFAKVSYGKYWNGDSGVTVELKRFFRDVAISFDYRNLEHQSIGAKISFPLTPRRVRGTPMGQIEGKKDFYYSLRTSINLDDGSNRIILSDGVVPKIGINLASYYLNRDRLNRDYILQNIDRLREAYMLYNI